MSPLASSLLDPITRTYLNRTCAIN